MVITSTIIDPNLKFSMKLTVIKQNGDREHMFQSHKVRYLMVQDIITDASHLCAEVHNWKERNVYWIDDEGDFISINNDLYSLALSLDKITQVKLPHFVLQPNKAQQLPTKILFSEEKK